MTPHRSQVGDEKPLASQHLPRVSLGQVVEVGEGMQGGVTAGEGGGGGQQEGVEGDQLPGVQLSLPGDTTTESQSEHQFAKVQMYKDFQGEGRTALWKKDSQSTHFYCYTSL